MIRRIFLKMTGPQILASVSSMLCLLIDSTRFGSADLPVPVIRRKGTVYPVFISFLDPMEFRK